MRKYRSKKEYVLREITGMPVLITIGSGVADFSGIINLNESAKVLWNCLQNGTDFEGLCDALLDNFDISREQAEKDVLDTIAFLTERKMIEEYEQ